jgi:hypothetical protein
MKDIKNEVKELEYRNRLYEQKIKENNKRIEELTSKKFKKFVLIVEEVGTERFDCGGCCFSSDEMDCFNGIDCKLEKSIYKIVEVEEHDL